MRCELKKIGFFHYGDEMADPTESLRACFEEASKNTALSDCVIGASEAVDQRTNPSGAVSSGTATISGNAKKPKSHKFFILIDFPFTIAAPRYPSTAKQETGRSRFLN